jgi:myxalamid-type polyketide synthase MxaB
VRLQLAGYGSPDQLRVVPLERRAPGPGEIEVEIYAASLNFRDVLIALGMMEEHYARVFGIEHAADLPLGFDCAGRVLAVGEGVTSLEPGDEVMVTTAGALGSHLTCYAEMAVRKPAGIDFEQTAAIPSVFWTAYYALVRLAGVASGERVLIHAAAGGVGLAAIQLARAAGAEVFATASPAKWDYLRSLGVQHVMTSRTLDFAERVLEATGGEGVDVVLNSLSGAAIERSFAALKRGGRFVEIGKMGIWTPEEVTQRRPDAQYFTFDLGDIPYRQPGLFHEVLEEIRELFDAGQLQPLPHTVFPFQDAVAAYRYMQQARHIGKIVLSLGADRAPVRPDASYLVTGGLRGLGLAVSRHLVELGARHLVLPGRSAPNLEVAGALRDLEARGVTVTALKADVAQASDVTMLIGACQDVAPLRGIVHAAGVIEDAILPNQSADGLARVMAPKVSGAWELHRQSETLGLDFLVLFSSMASLTGSPGQVNYAAGNAFMDALAYQRQAQELPALSISWGPWAQIGMAARLDRADQGVGTIEPETGLEVLTELLQPATRGSVAQVGVMRVDWNVFRNRLMPTQSETFLAAFFAGRERWERRGRTISCVGYSGPMRMVARRCSTPLSTSSSSACWVWRLDRMSAQHGRGATSVWTHSWWSSSRTVSSVRWGSSCHWSYWLRRQSPASLSPLMCSASLATSLSAAWSTPTRLRRRTSSSSCTSECARSRRRSRPWRPRRAGRCSLAVAGGLTSPPATTWASTSIRS